MFRARRASFPEYGVVRIQTKRMPSMYSTRARSFLFSRSSRKVRWLKLLAKIVTSCPFFVRTRAMS